MNITFYEKPDHVFDPSDLKGGTMRFVVSLADYFSVHGHQVSIVGNITKAHTQPNAVRFRPLLDVPMDSSDVFVAVSNVAILQRVTARLKLVLMFDEKTARSDGVAFERANEWADAIICQSETNRQCILRLGAKPDKLIVPRIIGGYDRALVPCKLTRVSNLLLFAAATIPEKGLDIALDGFALLKQEFPDVRLDVYGSADMWMQQETILHKRTDLIAQFPEIRIIGRRPLPDIYLALSRARLLLAPIRYEDAGSLIYICAQACGCPIVGPMRASLREIVIDGYTGALYYPNTPQELANTVSRLLRDPTRLDWMSKNAMEWVKNWTWNEVGACYLEIIESLLRRTRSQGATQIKGAHT